MYTLYMCLCVCLLMYYAVFYKTIKTNSMSSINYKKTKEKLKPLNTLLGYAMTIINSEKY